MKLLYIYWTLLIISFVSSGLLFLIVASETSPHGKSKHKHEVINNTTIRDTGQDVGDVPEILKTFNPQFQDNEDLGTCTESFDEFSQNTEIIGVESIENLEVKDNLNQQPNLSQSISESGQAVVLTLVDSASAELQNLAEPHLPDTQSQSGIKNLSQKPSSRETDTTINLPSGSSGPPLASVPTILLPTEGLNDTEEAAGDVQHPSEPVVVRAEQKLVEETSSELTGSTEKSPTDHEDPVPISGELDEGAARAKVSGSTEEATAAILDGLVGAGGSEPHEDIPSFSEWAQKRLEEAEKKKTHPNASIQTPGGPGRGVGSMKMRWKNYASPDCGAKIVAVNPEAGSARSVLVSTRDEYMLNKCTSRIWFVVELCEAIQAKKIELANFELFSSSPKEFSAYVSDRFPTRDWSAVGHFTAKDERNVQSFNLQPHLFGKFIKIELHSHYGSEHYCPISQFRAYGTSEFEVLETETEIQDASDGDDDDDDDEELSDNDGDSSRNLFGSARDVVFRIVKKAAEVLVKSDNPSQINTSQSHKSHVEIMADSFHDCMTPKYAIICDYCTENLFEKVFQLLSCRARDLDAILKISFINQTLRRTELCKSHGIDLKNSTKLSHLNKKSDKRHSMARDRLTSFLDSVFAPEYIVVLCNVLAKQERQLSLNSTYKIVKNISSDSSISIDIHSSKHEANDSSTMSQVSPGTLEAPSLKSSSHSPKPREIVKEESSSTATKVPSPMEIIKTPDILASQIKPTKTMGKEDLKKESSVPILESSKDPTEETIQAEVLTTPSPLLNAATATLRPLEEPLVIGVSIDPVPHTSKVINVESDENVGVETALPKSEEGKDNLKTDGLKIEEKDEKLKEKDTEDIKFTAQDQLSLDTLLSDLKDLEGDSSIHGQGNSASTVAYPAASTTPQQKESVFLRLANRIKALERNMSLSSQYLEELSRRYKKQVEEMQRSLERATSAMGEEFKKNEERESKRIEEVVALKEEVSSLTESMEELLYDRNSWRTKFSTFGQHIALIFIEILFLIIIISYCRRSAYDVDNTSTKIVLKKEISRRKSAESMDSESTKKKTRRPSEIASKITGTYRELLIDSERSELRKERKKKRKRDSLMRLSSNIEARRDIFMKISPSRRASSIDCSNLREVESARRPESAPDCSRDWAEESLTFKEEEDPNRRIVIEEIDGKAPELALGVNQVKSSPRALGILRSARLHSHSFMKTALSKGKKEFRSNSTTSQSVLINSDNWEYYSGSSRSGQDSPSSLNAFLDPNINNHNGDSTTNGHHEVSDESGSGNATPTPGKKVKKEGGLRKMVRKLF